MTFLCNYTAAKNNTIIPSDQIQFYTFLYPTCNSYWLHVAADTQYRQNGHTITSTDITQKTVNEKYKQAKKQKNYRKTHGQIH